MALVMRQCGVNDDWIPGLQVPLTIHDLRQGRKYHNELSYGNKDQDQDQDHGRHRESLRQFDLLETVSKGGDLLETVSKGGDLLETISKGSDL
ncbi:hypothetical protein Forpe1208_v015898 [Fusarium oxysporum f. sp. rapae]|uniref:Uncharacterized protein n=1 Tax=Fusarium oxysporum f. sp. rapae TaxID=485398 RepID=A0A8J5TMK0_FUSOX|nr:hypothetical protein Forpe1208_v015898 [Fusarium oxysporum f. sp. rapae]